MLKRSFYHSNVTSKRGDTAHLRFARTVLYSSYNQYGCRSLNGDGIAALPVSFVLHAC